MTGWADARNHVSNCLTDQQYEWHETHISLTCFIKANQKTGLIDYYQEPNVATKVMQGKGPWIQIHASEVVISDGLQFLHGPASDYNGNHAPLRLTQKDGIVEFQQTAYFLVMDAECQFKPIGYLSPAEKLDPAELCRIKNNE